MEYFSAMRKYELVSFGEHNEYCRKANFQYFTFFFSAECRCVTNRQLVGFRLH